MSKAKTHENKILSLLRVLRAGQITLPADLRRRAGIEEGDYLEAQAVEGGVFLRPVAIQSREDAWAMIRNAQAAVRYTGSEPEPSDEELLEQIDEERHG